MTEQHPDPRIIVGATYRDDSHGDEFTIEGIDPDDGSIDLDNGQWYDVSGPEGLVAKLDDGRVRRILIAGEEQ